MEPADPPAWFKFLISRGRADSPLKLGCRRLELLVPQARGPLKLAARIMPWLQPDGFEIKIWSCLTQRAPT